MADVTVNMNVKVEVSKYLRENYPIEYARMCRTIRSAMQSFINETKHKLAAKGQVIPDIEELHDGDFTPVKAD